METEVKPSIAEALPSHFKFHYDLEQGWLEVPYSAVNMLNLKRQISTSSHQRGTLVYLEEGLDAPIFIRAYLKKIGKPGDHHFFNDMCSHVYGGEISTIRSFPKYDNRNRQIRFQV